MGSPVALVTGSVSYSNVVSYSPAPTTPAAGATSAQLGIGLGVGLGLAAILGVAAVVAFWCCHAGRGKPTLEQQAEAAVESAAVG